MRCLLILGAGGHGKVVAETAETMRVWDEIAFLDDRYPVLSKVLQWPVVGPLRSLDQYAGRCFADGHVALGDSGLRLHWLRSLKQAGFELPPLVHASAWVSPSARLGDGCVVMARAVVNAATHIGRAGIINTGATVDHDCLLGDGVHVCPGVHLAGEVEVGDMAFLGIGSVTRQRVRIGRHAVVGAGAVVLGEVDDGTTVVGVPAVPFGRTTLTLAGNKHSQTPQC